jgi:hypothetical protein
MAYDMSSMVTGERTRARKSGGKTAPPAGHAPAYVGVRWEKHHGKWAAWIWVNDKGRGERIAHFDDPFSAAIARDRVALHLMGPRGRVLNFPRKKLKAASIAEIRAERLRDRLSERDARTGIGYLGVYPHDDHGKTRWSAQICIDGRVRSAGAWATERAAALAYDRVSLHLKGRAVNLPKLAARLGPASVEQVRAAAAKVNKDKKSSQYRGVHWHRSSGKWRANIRVDGVLVDLGLFTVEEDAARKYDRAAREAWGSAAKVNFL